MRLTMARQMRFARQILFYALSFGLFAACATQPDVLPPTELGQNPYQKLYEGQSDTVFATLFPPATAVEAVHMGDVAASEGHDDEALYRYVQALYLDNTAAQTFYKIGLIHTNRSNYDLARTAYVQTINLEEDYAPAVEALGLTQLKLQEYSAAEETLERARALRPQSWRTLNSLGIVKDINKNHVSAREMYKEAIELNPDLAEIQINLGYSYYLTGDFNQAIDVFNGLLSKDSSQKRAWMNLGLAYFKIEKYQKAVKSFNRVVNLSDAYNNVGYLCFLQALRSPQSDAVDELIDTARTYFERAIKHSVKYHAKAEQNLLDLDEWILTERRFPESKPTPRM